MLSHRFLVLVNLLIALSSPLDPTSAQYFSLWYISSFISHMFYSPPTHFVLKSWHSEIPALHNLVFQLVCNLTDFPRIFIILSLGCYSFPLTFPFPPTLCYSMSQPILFYSSIPFPTLIVLE